MNKDTYYRALAGDFDPEFTFPPEPGKKWGPLTGVIWDRLTGAGADAPQVRACGVFRPSQTVASMTSCGAASTLSGIPPTGGLIWWEVGALGGSDNCQVQLGLHLGVPVTGVIAPPHGFYVTGAGVQHTITPPAVGGAVSNCNTAFQNPTLGARLAIVRWDDTRMSWFRQAGADSIRMIECMFVTAPALAGQTLYPSVQLSAKGSGLANAKIAQILDSTL